MKENSKPGFSGFIIIIILVLILVLSIITVLTRNASEDKLIELGFAKLQQYSRQLQSKIDVLYLSGNTGNRDWTKKDYFRSKKDYSMIYCDGKWFIVDNKKKTCDSLKVANTISYDFLDRTFFNEFIIFDDNDIILYKSLKALSPDSSKYMDFLKSKLYLPASNKILSLKKESDLKDIYHNSGFISKTVVNYAKYYQFVYPFKINDQKFYISGLLTNINYSDKKKHVETWVLIVIGILLLFTLFSFPFLKLFLLSKTERIKTSDLVMLCFSISGIACIVTLLIINLSTIFSIRDKSEKQLKDLSDSIKTTFVDELNLMHQIVKDYEELYKTGSDVKGHILTDPIFESSFSCLKRKMMAYPYFKVLFHSDSSSMSDDLLTTWGYDNKSRISYRDYYKKKDEWLLPGPGEERRFRLQSIYSNTSGDVSAVLAKPSKTLSDTVYCISSPMYSVINTVLPPGFEFRIIGQDGLVWFHNNQQKNTRENFFDECDHDDLIQEVIHNRVETSFRIKISMNNYLVHISPIGILPLYMITLCSTQEQNEFLSHVNYVLFIFLVTGLLFAAIAAVIFYYEKIDKGKDINAAGDCEPGLIWLIADYRKNKRYIVLFSLNLVLTLLITLPALFGRCTVLHLLLILFSAYSVSFIFTYILLKSISPKVIKKSLIITYSLIIVVCNIIYFICLPPFKWFIISELLAIALISLIVIMVMYNNLFPKLKETVFESKIKFLWSSKYPYLPYSLFICSWLVTGCILPTIWLFRTAGREEVDLVTRKTQLEIATKIEQKGIQIDSFYIEHIYPGSPIGKSYLKLLKDKHKLKGDNLLNGYNPAGDPYLNLIKANLKQKGNYLLKVSDVPVSEYVKTWAFTSKRLDSSYIILSKYLHQNNRKEDFRSYQMLYGVGLDTAWFWTGGYFSRTKSDTLTFHYQAKQENAKGFYSGYQLKLSSVLSDQKTAKITGNYKSVLFCIAVSLAFLIFLFLLIRIIIKKLFILQRPVIQNKFESPGEIPQSLNIFLVNTLNHYHITRRISSTYDILKPDHTLGQKTLQDVIVILNPLPESPGKWNDFINTLEKLLARDSGQVILLSPYTPVQIREIVEEQFQSSSAGFTKEALTEINLYLMRLFSHFTVCFMSDKDYGKVLAGELGLDKSVPDNELVIGNIEGALTPVSQKGIYGKDNLPGCESDIYSLLISQYHYLWKTCTTNEKLILIDLSTDSLVNSKNKEDIKNLIGKGILDVDGKLCFVSKGFHRYVSGMVDSEEFIRMESNSKRVGGWDKIKNPLYLIFGVIVVFFFITQPEIIQGLNGAIISVTGFLGALLKILSMSGKSGQNDHLRLE